MLTDDAVLGGAANRRSMTRVVYAAFFLIASSAVFVGTFAAYDHRLIVTAHTSASVVLDSHSDLLAALFSVITLALATLIALPALRERPVPRTISLPSNVGWGVLAGLSAFVIAIPTFLHTSKHSTIGHYLAGNMLNAGGASLLAIILIALPVASETFFRRILFWAMLNQTSLFAALLATTLLFAIIWPLFNPIAAIVLGAVTCILFYRTRSLFACIIANSLFTLSCAALLVWVVVEHT